MTDEIHPVTHPAKSEPFPMINSKQWRAINFAKSFAAVEAGLKARIAVLEGRIRQQETVVK